MGFQLTYDIVEACNAIKDAAIRAAKARRAEEIARGVKLFDGTMATMKGWLHPAETVIDNDSDNELFTLWKAVNTGNQNVVRCDADPMIFERGTTTYFTARDTWEAFVPIRNLIMESGASEEEFYHVGPVLFPWTFGVLTLLRRYDTDMAPHILVGIRSKQLAGRHVGTVSFPGGLVHPKESIEHAARRQMREECGIEIETMENGFAIGLHPNAPSTTFMCVANTTSHEVSDSFEWKGGQAVWASEESVIQALDGNNSAMVGAFRKVGLDVNEGVAIAPDAAEPARLLLNHIYPAPACPL